MFASLFFTFPKRTKNKEKLYMDKAFKHTKEVGIMWMMMQKPMANLAKL